MGKKRGNTRHRRGHRGFLYKLLTVLSICAVIVVAMTLFFRVNEIIVTGNQRYTEETVAEATGVMAGDNLFLLNKRGAATALVEQLPYVEYVRISRKLPDTLLVEITECGETLAIPQETGIWLISDSGKIVDVAEETGGKIEILGCELLAPSVGTHIAVSAEYQNRQDSLLELISALKQAEKMDRVQRIQLDDADRLVMDYAHRFAVEMPYGADYEKMLLFTETVISKLESNETGIIDLTTEGEAYVRKAS